MLDCKIIRYLLCLEKILSELSILVKLEVASEPSILVKLEVASEPSIPVKLEVASALVL